MNKSTKKQRNHLKSNKALDFLPNGKNDDWKCQVVKNPPEKLKIMLLPGSASAMGPLPLEKL